MKRRIIFVLAITCVEMPFVCAKPVQRNLDAGLLTAINDNNFKKAKFLLSQGASVNARDADGETALIKARFVGEPKEEPTLRVHPLIFLKLLLSHGANTNLKDKDGNTALMTAAKGSPEAVKRLIAKGAQINVKNNNGETALMQTIDWECEGSCSSPDTVKLLLSKGADINSLDKDGNTALIWAARLPSYARVNAIAIVKMLLAKGANINARSKNGNTALKWAKMNGHTAIIRVLNTTRTRA